MDIKSPEEQFHRAVRNIYRTYHNILNELAERGKASTEKVHLTPEVNEFLKRNLYHARELAIELRDPEKHHLFGKAFTHMMKISSTVSHMGHVAGDNEKVKKVKEKIDVLLKEVKEYLEDPKD